MQPGALRWMRRASCDSTLSGDGARGMGTRAGFCPKNSTDFGQIESGERFPAFTGGRRVRAGRRCAVLEGGEERIQLCRRIAIRRDWTWRNALISSGQTHLEHQAVGVESELLSMITNVQVLLDLSALFAKDEPATTWRVEEERPSSRPSRIPASAKRSAGRWRWLRQDAPHDGRRARLTCPHQHEVTGSGVGGLRHFLPVVFVLREKHEIFFNDAVRTTCSESRNAGTPVGL